MASGPVLQHVPERILRIEPGSASLKASSKKLRVLLGGSWVVISRVISPLIWVISTVTLLVTPLITTHEPPSIHPKINLSDAHASSVPPQRLKAPNSWPNPHGTRACSGYCLEKPSLKLSQTLTPEARAICVPSSNTDRVKLHKCNDNASRDCNCRRYRNSASNHHRNRKNGIVPVA